MPFGPMIHRGALRLALLLSLFVLGACQGSSEDKLGTLDEPCFSDNDCRAAYLCEDQRCVLLGDGNDDENNNFLPANNADGSNNGSGSTNNLPGENNNAGEPIIDPENNGSGPVDPGNNASSNLCDEVCEFADACGADELAGEDCLTGCYDFLNNGVGDEETLECFLSLSCSELRNSPQRCLGDAIDPIGPGDEWEAEVGSFCSELTVVGRSYCDSNGNFYEDVCYEYAPIIGPEGLEEAWGCLEYGYNSLCQEMESCLLSLF